MHEHARLDRIARMLAGRRTRRSAMGVAGLAAATAVAARHTQTAAQDATPAATPCAPSTEEENVATARRWYDVLNSHDFDGLDAFVSADIVHDVGTGPSVAGIDHDKDYFGALLAAFPDMRVAVEDVLADGDRVAVDWTMTGTHQGAWLGVEPTGLAVTITGINIFRFACGVIVAAQSEADNYSLLMQFGALPSMPSATPGA